MKVYRREVEENGIVVDPLKCFHTIKVTKDIFIFYLIFFFSFFKLRVLPVMKFVDIFMNFNIEWNGKVSFNNLLNFISNFYF